MERHFEQDLQYMEERFLEMGTLVQEAIHRSLEALRNLDGGLAMEVVDHMEPEIDRFNREIDRLGFDLLALQQPLATDLRLVTAMMKNNNDLERMGDKAVNVALRTISMASQAPAKPAVDIARMANATEAMVRDALDAFRRRDDRLAREVLQRDDEIDRYRDAIFRELVAEMTANPQLIQQGLDLILVSRNLERIADHATNIAEWVIFLVLGRDLHSPA